MKRNGSLASCIIVSSISIVSAKTRTCELHAAYNCKCNTKTKTGHLPLMSSLMYFTFDMEPLISVRKSSATSFLWGFETWKGICYDVSDVLFSIIKIEGEMMAWNLIMFYLMMSQKEVAQSGASDFQCLLFGTRKCNMKVDLLDFPAWGGIQDQISE